MKLFELTLIIALYLFFFNTASLMAQINESVNETIDFNFTPNITATRKWAFISEKANISFEIDNPEIAVTSLELIIENELENAAINVIRFLEKPLYITRDPEDVVYQYFDLNTSNLEMRDVNYSEMTFTVLKEWVRNETIMNGSIRIFRYIRGSWESLMFSGTDESESHLFFKITNPGFYYFAITGKRIPTPEEQYICTPGDFSCSWNFTRICNGTDWIVQEECEYECIGGECVFPPPDYRIHIIIIAAVLIIGLVSWRFRTRIYGLRKVNREEVYDKLNR